MRNFIINVMVAIINQFHKGEACTIVQEKVASDKEFNKGRGANRNPYLDGRLVIRNIFSGYVMGTDYANSIANAHNRMSGDNIKGADVNTKPNWHIAFPSTDDYDFGVWFEKKRSEADGEETTAYLKIQRQQTQEAFHKTTTEYYLFGKLVTDEKTLADIEQWRKGKSDKQSSTQTEQGLDKAHEQHYKVLELKSLKMIKQGAKGVLNITELFG